MDALVTGIIHETKSELEKTKMVLANLKNEHKSWKPHEKSMTLGRLAAHVVELHLWLNNALKHESFDLVSEYRPLDFDIFGNLSDKLNEGVEKNLKFIEETDKDFWFELFTLKAGDHVLAKLPKMAFLRSHLMNHLIHHRGQLTVYMRLLEIPVPGTYGPSADDKA